MFPSKPKPEEPSSAKPSPGTTLEEILLTLARYGEPSIRQMGDGWHASCDMRVASQGAEFKVRSEFDHKTPTAAATECLSRIKTTLAQYGGE